ncbi:MAG: capsular exopolysaccharide family [Mucilaginibacter sp.]|nr:capsular exopolysaccharide family [Mucilaginibacter sp.]
MKLLTKYFKYWPWFAVSIGVFVILGYILLWYVDPVYQVTTTVLIQEEKKGENQLAQTAFSDLNMFHTNKSVDNETQVLLSVDLLQRAFSELSLNTKYYLNGTFKRKELYRTASPINVVVKKLTPEAYQGISDINIIDDDKFEMVSSVDNETHIYHFGETITTPKYTIQIVKGPAFSLANRNLSVSFTDIKAMAKSYHAVKLQISPVVKDANTLLIAVNDNLPQRGVDILTKLIETYNKISDQTKISLANATISFIDNRLKYLNSDLATVEQKVQQYKQNNNVTNSASDAQLSIEKAAEYGQALQAANVQLNIVGTIEDYMNKPDDQFTVVPSTLGIQDATLIALINRYNEIQLEYQRLLRNSKASNPLVLSTKEQLSSVKENIQENLKNIKSALLINRDNISRNLSRFESKIRTAPAIETGIQQRDRDQSVKQSLFQYLTQKREETSLSLLANQPDAKVVDSPNYDPNGGKPKAQLIYLTAFIIGSILPIFLLFAKETLSRKVEKVEDVNTITDLRILGELCHINKKESIKGINNSRSSMAELFRYIRTNLNFVQDGSYNQVFLVTSCVQGEGKTFTSLNLGRSLSSINKKTVILEFDLRKPDLLKSISLEQNLGISDYLNSNDIKVDSLLQPSNVSPNLFVIGCGTKSKNPGEMMLSPKIKELFIQLRLQFDYIIVDTPPVGLVADAFSLTPYVDSSIYVIRYNFTQKSHLSILKDIYDNNKLKNPMLVLNDAKANNIKSYVYGSYTYA